MTITIELPEDLVAHAAAAGIDDIEINRIASAGAFGAVAAVSSRAEAAEPDPEVIAAGLEALEDIAAGRLLTLEEVDANVEAVLAERRAARERERASSGVPAGNAA